MSRTIFDSIIAAKYIATETQVQALAACVANGVQAEGTYLKVLVAHVHQELDATGRQRVNGTLQLEAVNKVHERLYASVLAGVSDDEMPSAERTRRAKFASSAASDLRHFIKQGGNVRKLKPENVRKNKLRSFGAPVPTGTRPERVLMRSLKNLLRVTQHMAKDNVDGARMHLEAARTQINEALAALPVDVPKAARVSRAPRARARVQMPLPGVPAVNGVLHH